jgi:hypothetical protein
MEKGVNILTNSQPVIVEGAEELIAEYEQGGMSQEELYSRLMDLETVYVDQTKFKDKNDPR